MTNNLLHPKTPYNPESPHYIQPGLTEQEIESLLLEVGV